MKHLKLFEDRLDDDYTSRSNITDNDDLLVVRKEKLTRIENPLNMKNKISARKWIYKISNPIICPPGQSMFKDDSWEPVTKLFRKWNELKVDWDFYANPRYFNFPMTDDMKLPRKEWYITIKWFNDKGRASELVGTLVAAFDGPRDNPTERYDLTLVI